MKINLGLGEKPASSVLTLESLRDLNIIRVPPTLSFLANYRQDYEGARFTSAKGNLSWVICKSEF